MACAGKLRPRRQQKSDARAGPVPAPPGKVWCRGRQEKRGSRWPPRIPRCGYRKPLFDEPLLRREAAQRPADVSLTEPLERPVTELPYPLARDAKHRADLLQRVLAPALQPEVEPEDLRVARWERRERLLDLVGEEAVHRLLLGVGHLVGDEPLDERAVALGVHRRVEAHVARVERGERLHDVDREPGELRQLLGARLAAELLAEDLRRLDDARQGGGGGER